MRALTLAPLLVLLGGVPAAGQTSFTRADLQGTLGWYNIQRSLPDATYHSGEWMNAILQGDAAAGWFWTEHLRTTLDAGVNSTGRQYQDTVLSIGGQQVYRTSQLGLRQWQIGVGQQYQFGHNAWFHPHAGGGALVAFQRLTTDTQPDYYFDSATRTTRTVGGVVNEGTTRTIVRPFVDLGFKAYVSRRVYFVHDTRFVAGPEGLEQLGFKFGFGVDFW